MHRAVFTPGPPQPVKLGIVISPEPLPLLEWEIDQEPYVVQEARWYCESQASAELARHKQVVEKLQALAIPYLPITRTRQNSKGEPVLQFGIAFRGKEAIALARESGLFLEPKVVAAGLPLPTVPEEKDLPPISPFLCEPKDGVRAPVSQAPSVAAAKDLSPAARTSTVPYPMRHVPPMPPVSSALVQPVIPAGAGEREASALEKAAAASVSLAPLFFRRPVSQGPALKQFSQMPPDQKAFAAAQRLLTAAGVAFVVTDAPKNFVERVAGRDERAGGHTILLIEQAAIERFKRQGGYVFEPVLRDIRFTAAKGGQKSPEILYDEQASTSVQRLSDVAGLLGQLKLKPTIRGHTLTLSGYAPIRVAALHGLAFPGHEAYLHGYGGEKERERG